MAQDAEMSVTQHLEELRRVIIICLLSVFIASIISFVLFRNEFLEFILKPIDFMELDLVFLSVTEAFLTKFKLSILSGFIIALPIIFWQVWGFVVPALRENEKKVVLFLVFSSLVLFLIGIIFAYTTVFQIATRFLLIEAGEGLTPMISISKYVSFLILFHLPFGIVFQLPLVIGFLSKLGLVDHRKLAKKRKYAIVAIFILAAILTPPDIISQTLLALPMVLLYEISIYVAKIFKPKKESLEEV